MWGGSYTDKRTFYRCSAVCPLIPASSVPTYSSPSGHNCAVGRGDMAEEVDVGRQLYR